MFKYGLILLCFAGALNAVSIDVYSIQPATPAGYQSDQFGNLIGPYQLNTSLGPLQVMCMDLFYGVNPPYVGYDTPISDVPQSPLTTYLADPVTYEEETFLYSLIVNAPDLETQAEIQDAAWALTFPSFLATLQGTNDPQATATLVYLNLVLTMQANGTLATALDYSQYHVLSNVEGPGSNTQEFIYRDGTVPEPTSLALTGLCLVGFAVVVRTKRRRRSQLG